MHMRSTTGYFDLSFSIRQHRFFPSIIILLSKQKSKELLVTIQYHCLINSLMYMRLMCALCMYIRTANLAVQGAANATLSHHDWLLDTTLNHTRPAELVQMPATTAA